MVAVKVTVSADVCGGHGDCVMLAPDVFDFRDSDVVTVITPNPPDELREQVYAARDTCPTGAIAVAEQSDPHRAPQ